MFKLGGSTGEGITSGLTPRKRFANGGVDWEEVVRGREQIKGLYGPPPKRGYSGWDALTEFGLNLASGTPRGNIISTAAHEAKEPFEKFTEGKGESEMADWMANMAATDKSLAAVTDIAVAKAKAQEFNKDFTKERRIEDAQKEIYARSQNNPASFGATLPGSLGMAQGMVEIIDLQKEKGNKNLPVDIITLTDVEGTGNFSFDPNTLDAGKVWWDPKKKAWMIIVTTTNPAAITSTNPDGKTGVPEYFYSFDSAHSNLGKTKALPAEPTGPKDEGEKGFFEKLLSDEKTTQEEMDIYAKESWKKTKEDVKERFQPKGDITKGDTRGYETNQDLKNIVQVEKKKAQKEKNYDEVYKWWKDNEPNLSYGYQGWPGVN